MSEDRATYPSCQRRLGAGRPEKTSWARPWALPVLKDLEALVDHGEEEPLADLLAPALHSSFQASTGFHQRGLHRVAALSTRPRRSRRAASCPSTCGPRPAWPRPPGPPEVSVHAMEDGRTQPRHPRCTTSCPRARLLAAATVDEDTTAVGLAKTSASSKALCFRTVAHLDLRVRGLQAEAALLAEPVLQPGAVHQPQEITRARFEASWTRIARSASRCWRTF